MVRFTLIFPIILLLGLTGIVLCFRKISSRVSDLSAHYFRKTHSSKGSALLQPGEDAGIIDMKALREQASAQDAAADRHDHSSKSQKYGAQ